MKLAVLVHGVKGRIRHLETVLTTHSYDFEKIFTTQIPHMPDMAAFDGLIIMGGPQHIYDRPSENWLDREMTWVESFLKTGKPVFGICLGGQMLAAIHGGRVEKGSHGQHIGFHPLKLDVTDDPVFGDELKGAHTFYWHEDTYLLADGTRLASAYPYTEQAAKYAGNVYGVQFHPEVTEDFIRDCYNEVTAEGNYPAHGPALNDMLSQAPGYMAQQNDWLEKFILRLFAR